MKISYKLSGILGFDFVTVDYEDLIIIEGTCGNVSEKSLKEGLIAHDFQIVKCADNDVIIDTYAAYFCKYADTYDLNTCLEGLTALLRSFLQASDHRKVYYIPYSNSAGNLYYVSNIALVNQMFTDSISSEIFNQASRGYIDAFLFIPTDKVNAFEMILLNSGFENLDEFDYDKLDDMDGYLDSDILCFSTVYAVMSRTGSLDYVAMKHDDFSYTGQLKVLCASLKANVSMQEIFDLLASGFFDESEESEDSIDIVDCLGVSKDYTIDGDYLYIYATDSKSIPKDAVIALREHLMEFKGEYGDCGLIQYRNKIFDCLCFNVEKLRLWATLDAYELTIDEKGDGAYNVSLFVSLKGSDFVTNKLCDSYGITVRYRWSSIEKVFKSFYPVLQYELLGNSGYSDFNYYYEQTMSGSARGIFSFCYSVDIACRANLGFALALIAMVFDMLLPYLNKDSDEDFDEYNISTLQLGDEQMASLKEVIGKRFSPAIQRRVLLGDSIENLLKDLGIRFNDKYQLFSPYSGLFTSGKKDYYGACCWLLDEIFSGRTNCKITDIDLRKFVECANRPSHVKGMILANMYRKNPLMLQKLAKNTNEEYEVDYDEAERLLGGYLANG